VSEPITIPLEIDGAEALRTLERFAQGMGAAATKTDDAGKSAAASSLSWTELNSALSLVSGAFNRIVAVADQVAALTAEQQQLSAASQRLGLDFNEAADGAGRFVDETEAMAAASRLAEAGLHLTQDELNQLTARAAIASQRLGVDTTTAFNMLTTAIESGSARALRPFGEDMVALGGSTHSAEERLSAFTTTTRGMERATDDASTSMARLRDSIGDAEREAASAFSAELLRLQEVTAQTNTLSSRVDDTEHKLRALGQMAATAALGTLNGIAVVVSAVAMGIVGTIATARGALAGLQAMAHGGSFTGAMRASVQGDDASRETLQFLEERIAALNALAEDTGSTAGRGAVRGLIGAGAPTTSGDMVFGESQAAADDAYAAARRRRPASGGSSQSSQRATLDQLMTRAGAAERFQVTGSGRLDDGSAEAERALADQAAKDRRAEEQTATTREEQDAARRARSQSRSIGGGMREALTRYGDTAMHTRDLVVGAFNDMTDAVGKHIEAVVMGRESLGEAVQGMLSDTLAAIAKRASVSAAEELVASLASLAVGDLRGAGLHGAAAVGYTAVAALAGAGSAAAAPSAPSAPSASGAGASRSAGDVTPRAAGKSGGGDGQTVNVYFGGPVIGAGGARQAAREVVGLLNDGARQGGVRLSPNIMPMGA
jgi:ribosomal protein L35